MLASFITKVFFLLFTVQLLAIKRLLCCTKEDFNPLCSSVSIQSCDQPTKLLTKQPNPGYPKEYFYPLSSFCPSNTVTNQPMYQLGIKWIIQPKKSKRCFLSFRQFVCRPILLNNQPNQATGQGEIILSWNSNFRPGDYLLMLKFFQILWFPFEKCCRLGFASQWRDVVDLNETNHQCGHRQSSLSPFGNMINY